MELRGRHDHLDDAAAGVEVVIVAVPDDAIATVAAAIRPEPGAAVVHLSGSRRLDVLEPHERRASLHPLVSLPDAETGVARLLDRCTFAVAGDPIARQLVAVLGGRAIDVPDEQRALYHATATVAANHLVALAGQVERLAAASGVPVDAYFALMGSTLDNVTQAGARASLTGPASRGDVATLRAHLRALPDDERDLYRCLARAATRLAGRPLPPLDEEPTP